MGFLHDKAKFLPNQSWHSTETSTFRSIRLVWFRSVSTFTETPKKDGLQRDPITFSSLRNKYFILMLYFSLDCTPIHFIFHFIFQVDPVAIVFRRWREMDNQEDENLKFTTRIGGDCFLDLKILLNFTCVNCIIHF